MAPQEPSHSQLAINRIILITGSIVTLFIGTVYYFHPSLIASTNNRTTDLIMGFAGRTEVSNAIVVVDIDDSSLALYGQWPWPRSRLAQLLRSIQQAGAASIGVDLLLVEPDRSPLENATTPPPNQDIAVATQETEVEKGNHDLILADTLSKGPYVLGFDLIFKGSALQEHLCELHPPGIVWVNMPDFDPEQNGFFTARGAICSLPLFGGAVTNSGFVNAAPDMDGVLRRVPMLIRYDGQLYPSLILAMLMKQADSRQIIAQKGEYGQLALKVGTRSIAIDVQGNMIVRFSPSAPAIPRMSAVDVLNGDITARQLKDTFVIIGLSASGMQQVYQTPAGPVQLHSTVHAQALNTLLTDQQVSRTRVFLLWEVLLGLCLAMAVSLMIAKLGIVTSALISLVLLLGCWVGVVVIFTLSGILLSPLLPTILVLSNFAILTILKTWRVEVEARKQAEGTLVLLKASEKQLHSIIHTVPDIIFRLDKKGRLTFISPAVSKYVADPDSLLGKPIIELVLPEDLPKAQNKINERRTGKRATNGLELRLSLSCEDHEVREKCRYFCISAEGIYHSDVSSSDAFLGTQGLLRDITDQKKMESRLQSAQKLEAVGSLAAGVAHDLNNILAGLVSYPDLLLLKLPKDSPLREDLLLIQQSGKNAAAIVQDLLTLGRRGAQVSSTIDLNTVITDYLGSLEFASILNSHEKVAITKDLAPDLLKVKGSQVHLAKAIMNLLINAMEAMPTGGTISLSSYNSCVDTVLTRYETIPPGDYVCVKVADQGIGIVGDDLHKIFEPFYSKKSMKRSGSGLGMTVIWATVRDHHGYIDLQSRDGEGTEFVLYIPATWDAEELPSQRVFLEDYLGTEKLLVVDDIPAQIRIVSSMLTKLGYDVATAASGEAALDYLRDHSVDLVLLDMIMPGGIDGLETYRKMAEMYPGIKAIITSGFSESERVRTIQELGVKTYIQKPYTLEKIGLAVRRELDRNESSGGDKQSLS